MEKFISYVHFIGFLPAFAMSVGDKVGWGDIIMSAIFSWGIVIAKLIVNY